ELWCVVIGVTQHRSRSRYATPRRSASGLTNHCATLPQNRSDAQLDHLTWTQIQAGRRVAARLSDRGCTDRDRLSVRDVPVDLEVGAAVAGHLAESARNAAGDERDVHVEKILIL